MFDDVIKDFKKTVSNIPPIWRCSFLLMLAELILNELPEAEKAFNEERDRMISQILEVLNRREE
jgi:hypothetical protein